MYRRKRTEYNNCRPPLQQDTLYQLGSSSVSKIDLILSITSRGGRLIASEDVFSASEMPLSTNPLFVVAARNRVLLHTRVHELDKVFVNRPPRDRSSWSVFAGPNIAHPRSRAQSCSMTNPYIICRHFGRLPIRGPFASSSCGKMIGVF
jgi:hypothetical protein